MDVKSAKEVLDATNGATDQQSDAVYSGKAKCNECGTLPTETVK